MSNLIMTIIILFALISYLYYRRKETTKLKAKGKASLGKTYLGLTLPALIFIVLMVVGAMFAGFMRASY